MTQKYELIVKGTRNFENKVTVILTLQDKERFAGEIFDLNINLERLEGAGLDYYEVTAVKHAKQFLRDLAEKYKAALLPLRNYSMSGSLSKISDTLIFVI